MKLFICVLGLGLLGSHPEAPLAAAPMQLQDEVESYEELRARELQGLVTRFKEHAEWCKKKKLWLQRALALEALLEFDPQNLDARKALGHRKQRDGSWTPKKGPRPVDRSKKDLEEAMKRSAELSAPFRDALKALYERDGGELPAVVKRKILNDVLAVDPEDAWARGERYEAKLDGEWVMMEVANAAKGREELRAQERELRGLGGHHMHWGRLPTRLWGADHRGEHGKPHVAQDCRGLLAVRLHLADQRGHGGPHLAGDGQT